MAIAEELTTVPGSKSFRGAVERLHRRARTRLTADEPHRHRSGGWPVAEHET